MSTKAIDPDLFAGLCFGAHGSTWAESFADPYSGAPPWHIAKRAPIARVVSTARGLDESTAAAADNGYDLTAKAMHRWAMCCWLWAVIALLEGRPPR